MPESEVLDALDALADAVKALDKKVTAADARLDNLWSAWLSSAIVIGGREKADFARLLFVTFEAYRDVASSRDAHPAALADLQRALAQLRESGGVPKPRLIP